MHRRKTSALAAAGLLCGLIAAPSHGSGVFEARALGMAGAGVAAANSHAAPLLNPALLALPSASDRFGIVLPVGGRAHDPDELFDAIDDFNNAQPIDAFRRALRAYDDAPGAGTAATVAARGESLGEHLRALSNKDLQAEGLAALVISKPNPSFGMSVFTRAHVAGGAVTDVSATDLALIEDAIDGALSSENVIDPTDDFTSAVNARIAGIAEVGLSFATRMESLAGIAIGVSPKYVRVYTYDYGFSGRDLDDVEIERDESERIDSDFNVDVGIAKEWGAGWVTALSARNLLEREYRTVRDNLVKIEPQFRLGLARRGETLTLALDVDLNESEPLGPGSATRYAIAGVELALLRALRLRAGYRHDFGDVAPGRDAGMASAGIGLSLLSLKVDAAVAGNGDEVNGALQFAFGF